MRLRTALFLACSAAILAQTPTAPGRAYDFQTIPRPPAPPDPLELVTGPAAPVQDALQRMAALSRLSKAQELSNVRGQPYDLKTTFISSGGLASDGNWMLEDTARGRKYRWTAQGPNFSAVNLYPDSVQNGLYGNQQSGNLPLRLLQVRSAIFFRVPASIGTMTSVRTATGLLTGAEQRCVLLVIGAGSRSFTGARNWEESEYCVDAQTGLLTTYSPVPGLFVHYDYSQAIRFHGKLIANAFTIWEAGQKVAEATTVSVNDPPDVTDPIFSPTGLLPLGAGRTMNPGMNMPIVMPVPGHPLPVTNSDAAIQVIALHGNVSGDGQLREVEVLASTDSTLNQTALDAAKSWTQGRRQGQPGATAQSSEMILTFEFVTPVR
jgi:hypothetical protein